MCAIEDLDVPDGRLWFAYINEVLASSAAGVSVSAGVAQPTAGESLDSLIARADADLYQQRQRRQDRLAPPRGWVEATEP